MFKQAIAFIFLAAFVLQTFDRAFIVLDYNANIDTYIKNCENIAKPQMKCKGKCQMMKKIKEEEKKEKQNPDRKAENKNEVLLSSKTFYPEIIALASTQKIKYTVVQTTDILHKMPRSVFRPPIG